MPELPLEERRIELKKKKKKKKKKIQTPDRFQFVIRSGLSKFQVSGRKYSLINYHEQQIGFLVLGDVHKKVYAVTVYCWNSHSSWKVCIEVANF